MPRLADVSACPYKKIYNWKPASPRSAFSATHVSRADNRPCAQKPVGRIRHLGVLLYDADRIEAAAQTTNDKDLYQAQLDIFLNPHDPAVQEAARKEGIPEAGWKQRNSPVYKMAMDWKVALPLHPEYRKLPMVWYVPR